MAAKFNKDMILKHRFWVLIGVTGILTLGGIAYLQLYGADAALAAEKKFSSVAKDAKNTRPSHNPKTIEYYEEITKKAQEAEAKVWRSAYKTQEDVFKWAPRVEAEFNFQNSKFAHDIKISRTPPERPEEKDFVIHGKFVELQTNYIRIETKKGDKGEKIFRMENIAITDTDNNNKPVTWGNEMSRDHLGKHVTVTYQSGKYFADPLVRAEQDAFADTYHDQIRQLLGSVDPVNEAGGGVVQLKNWTYSDTLPTEAEAKNLKFIRFVAKKWDVKGEFPKEAWIAQEDIWIQRELYRIFRSVNDSVSVFNGEGGDKRDHRYVFKNSAFTLTLTLQKDDTLVFEIKNLTNRRQKLDLNFRIQTSKTDKPLIQPISGPALMPAGEPGATFEKIIRYEKDSKEGPRMGIFGVEQILTAETAAIKRIDQITIGSIAANDIAQSHRAFPIALRPFDERDIVKPKEGGDAAKPPGAGNFGLGAAKQGAAAAGADKTKLPHDLWTDRYLDVTEQSRVIPIAMALIVEQDYVDRLLTQLNNSKLRFVASQVLLNHYTGNLGAPGADKKAGPGGPPGDNGPGIFRPGGGGFGLGGGPGVGQPPAQAAAAADVETNMEIVIYGSMTLYQRFPPRPAAEKKLP